MRGVLLMCFATALMDDPKVAIENTDPKDRLRSAEWFFHDGLDKKSDLIGARADFRAAGNHYERLLLGFSAPELYLNCGNAYFLADELPKAILAYRRGLRKHPLSGPLWENLELARDQVAYPNNDTHHRPPGDPWPPLLPRPTPDMVLYFTLALHAVAWLTLTGWLIFRRRPLGTATVILFVCTAITGAWWVYVQQRIAADEQQPLIVVTVNGATLRRGNGSMYPRHADLPNVNRGMEARLLHQRGDWVQVQFPGGEIGWLPRDAVLVDAVDE